MNTIVNTGNPNYCCNKRNTPSAAANQKKKTNEELTLQCDVWVVWWRTRAPDRKKLSFQIYLNLQMLGGMYLCVCKCGLKYFILRLPLSSCFQRILKNYIHNTHAQIRTSPSKNNVFPLHYPIKSNYENTLISVKLQFMKIGFPSMKKG